MSKKVLSVEERWEQGIEHHLESLALFKLLMKVDVNDYFEWQYGGDGDNGEYLMYLLDVHFGEVDNPSPSSPNV